MSRELFPSAAQPQGALSAVKDYWAEYPTRFASAWHSRFPGQRSGAATELFPHLPTSAKPRVGDAVAPVSSAKPLTGVFFDPAQTARAHCSPLGGVARTEQKP
jgi:hypothetical protein